MDTLIALGLIATAIGLQVGDTNDGTDINGNNEVSGADAGSWIAGLASVGFLGSTWIGMTRTRSLQATTIADSEL